MLVELMKKTQSLLLANKRNIIITIVTIVLLTVVAMYAYKTYIKPMLAPVYVPNKEFVEEGVEGGEADFIFFYVNWCPHCKSAMPAWDSVKTRYNERKINNTTVYFREVDCEKNEEEADKYKVTGYPTIKLLRGSEIIEFDAKPTEDALTQFLHTVL